jgi:hypothetical protein
MNMHQKLLNLRRKGHCAITPRSVLELEGYAPFSTRSEQGEPRCFISV